MVVRSMLVVATLLFVGAVAAVNGARPTPQDPAPAAGTRGWQIPEGARDEANPIAASPEVLEKGKKIYTSKCQRCHGPGGKGDGPDADGDMPPDDLTDASRAARNPDGVMFYKVWNGRRSPKMPAFKSEITKDEAWTVVTYAKSLRK